MRSTSIDKIKDLQLNVKNIRNICILAHVDHGKKIESALIVLSHLVCSGG